MRKLKEVLRLSSLGLKQQQIARSCRIAQSTVHGYLRAAAAAGVSWPLPPDWDDRRLEAVICGTARPTRSWRKRELPDFGAIREELQTHRNLTLQLVWEEYREQYPDGYRYSRFCELYRTWEKHPDVVLRQDYRAGEKMFIDYAGDKIPVYDHRTGEVDFEASLFVAVLGASSYTFAEASRSQELACWINSTFARWNSLAACLRSRFPILFPGTKSGFCGRSDYVAEAAGTLAGQGGRAGTWNITITTIPAISAGPRLCAIRRSRGTPPKHQLLVRIWPPRPAWYAT